MGGPVVRKGHALVRDKWTPCVFASVCVNIYTKFISKWGTDATGHPCRALTKGHKYSHCYFKLNKMSSQIG